MQRTVIQSKPFSRMLDDLLSSRQLMQYDYEEFEFSLIDDPQQGDVVPGTGGLRKTRLRSSAKGKSGGFRVYYFDIPVREKLYLLILYAKNVKEDLTAEEKKQCKIYMEQTKKHLNL